MVCPGAFAGRYGTSTGPGAPPGAAWPPRRRLPQPHGRTTDRLFRVRDRVAVGAKTDFSGVRAMLGSRAIEVMEDVMLKTALLLVALSPLATTAGSAPPAAQGASFPERLQGTWHPAPYDCGSPQGAGNDMRFEVSGRLRMSYEDIETVVAIAGLPGSPEAWRVTTTSNVVGSDEGQSRIYVLGKKYLFVSDGDRMDQYLQCR